MCWMNPKRAMKAAAVCLPDSQYNPEIGDTPSHRGALTHQRVSRL
jgi:hypothetical protein